MHPFRVAGNTRSDSTVIFKREKGETGFCFVFPFLFFFRPQALFLQNTDGAPERKASGGIIRF